MSEKLRIVFMGTPEFAVPTLRLLVDKGYDIAAVITSPDKPAGRGMKLQESAVKKFAISIGLPVLQPQKLKDPEFLKEYQSLEHNLNIVVAFRMLPDIIWSFPRLGTFNLHASLLPQYRGAAPINWAIINGENRTGLTTFFINEDIDTGKIILQREMPIAQAETAGELHDRMMLEGADLVLKTVEYIESGRVNLIDQSQLIKNQQLIIKPAPKIFKEDCRIDFQSALTGIQNLIRGLSPHPGAFLDLECDTGESLILKIYRSRIELFANPKESGTIESDGKTFLAFNHPEGLLYIDELQAPGKKRLPIDEFLRGTALLTARWIVK